MFINSGLPVSFPKCCPSWREKAKAEFCVLDGRSFVWRLECPVQLFCPRKRGHLSPCLYNYRVEVTNTTVVHMTRTYTPELSLLCGSLLSNETAPVNDNSPGFAWTTCLNLVNGLHYFIWVISDTQVHQTTVVRAGQRCVLTRSLVVRTPPS